MIPRSHATPLLFLAGLSLPACRAGVPPPRTVEAQQVVRVDDLIQPGESHFKHLWQVTSGGKNKAPRWSPDGKRLTFQSFDLGLGVECDRVRVCDVDSGRVRQVSGGLGVASGGSFLPDGTALLFASTHATQTSCPPPPSHGRGYVWSIDPEYDLYLANLETGQLSALVAGPGYDAEAAISPTGDLVVFSSSRSGDVELWACDLDGSNLRQLTHEPGYDGAACFNADGSLIAFRSTAFDGEDGAQQLVSYREQLARWTVAPGAMEVMVVSPDGSGRRQITHLGKANWSPCFAPGGQRIVFASNHHGEGPMPTNFDLFAVGLDGTGLEQITSFDEGLGRQFDGFPYFSPDGRFLAFSSNRGAREMGETNVFIAEWQ